MSDNVTYRKFIVETYGNIYDWSSWLHHAMSYSWGIERTWSPFFVLGFGTYWLGQLYQYSTCTGYYSLLCSPSSGEWLTSAKMTKGVTLFNYQTMFVTFLGVSIIGMLNYISIRNHRERCTRLFRIKVLAGLRFEMYNDGGAAINGTETKEIDEWALVLNSEEADQRLVYCDD